MKALLVVNVPKKMINGKYTYTLSLESKTSSCNNLKGKATLRPLPKKKESYMAEITQEDYYSLFPEAKGWNECLKWITGETE